MLIKDWWYAWRVCRKYKVKWNPFYNLDNASFTCSWKGENARVWINPFHKNFLGVFLHETGHILFWRKGASRFYWILEISANNTSYKRLKCNGRSYIGLLEEESLASRFSAKVLKTEENRADLIRAFYKLF